MIRAIKKRYKAIIAMTVVLVGTGIYLTYLLSGLPSLEQLENPRAELATKVYSIDGEVLDNFFVKNRSQITMGELPSHILEAIVRGQIRREGRADSDDAEGRFAAHHLEARERWIERSTRYGRLHP